MRFRIRATVTYEWEEDSDNWQGVEPTREAVLKAHMHAYIDRYEEFVRDGSNLCWSGPNSDETGIVTIEATT